MPTWNFHGTQETILAYAWICSHKHLRDAVLQPEKEHWQRLDGSTVIASLLEAEVRKVEATSLSGRLLRCGVARVDLLDLHATLTASSGIYYEESWEQQQAEAQTVPAGEVETGIVLESLAHEAGVMSCAHRLSMTWHGDVLTGGRSLFLFFLCHTQLVLRSLDVAFFVEEFVRLGLERVAWNTVAARLLGSPVPASALPAFTPPSGELSRRPALSGALLRECLWSIYEELQAWGSDAQLAEPMQALILFLRIGCLPSPEEIIRSDDGASA